MSQSRNAETRAAGMSVPSLARWKKAPVLPRPEECLALARAALARARQFLVHPTAETVLRSELAMSEVADRLRQFSRSLARAMETGAVNGPDLRRRAAAAKEELAQTNLLYQRSAQFYAGWTRLFSARRYGYTRTGAPAKLACSRQFVVRG
jgi:hypothetical protein